jgi:hypothetical protein
MKIIIMKEERSRCRKVYADDPALKKAFDTPELKRLVGLTSKNIRSQTN